MGVHLAMDGPHQQVQNKTRFIIIKITITTTTTTRQLASHLEHPPFASLRLSPEVGDASLFRVFFMDKAGDMC